METRYNWSLGQIETQQDGFITKINYTVSASNGKCSASVSGSVDYDPRSEDTFKPLHEVSIEDLIDWVQTDAGKDSIEAALAADIASQPDPTVDMTIPWKTPELA
jgi:hypothetical protein